MDQRAVLRVSLVLLLGLHASAALDVLSEFDYSTLISPQVDLEHHRFKQSDNNRRLADGTPAEEKITHFVEGVMKCFGIGSFGMTVVHDSKVLFSKGFGLRDPSKPERGEVDADTYFGIGSTTKAFTTTLLAMLVDEGKIHWEDKVEDLLGEEFALYNDEDSKRVTIVDLCSHMTGVARNDFWAITNPNSTRPYNVARVRHFPGNLEFREKYQYNNWMFLVAGRIVEKFEGVTWEEALEKRILSPLSMTRATPNVYDALKDGNYAYPNFPNSPQPPKTKEDWTPLPEDVDARIQLQGPAGAINASPRSMEQWLLFQLKRGVAESGERLVSQGGLDETHSPKSTTRSTRGFSRPKYPVSYNTPDYGLAWLSGSYRGYRQVSHTGATFAHKTLVSLFPDIGRGVFMSGGAGTDLMVMAEMLIDFYSFDVLNGEEPWLDVHKACTFPCTWENCTQIESPPKRQSAPAKTSDMSALEGLWCNMGYGCVRIDAHGKFTFNEMVAQVGGDEEKGHFNLTLIQVGSWKAGVGPLPSEPTPLLVNLDQAPPSIAVVLFEETMPPQFVRVG